MAFFTRSFIDPLNPITNAGTIGETDTVFYTGPSTRNVEISLATTTAQVFRIYDNEDSVATILANTIWRRLVEDTGTSIENAVSAGGGDRLIGSSASNVLVGGGAIPERKVGVAGIREGSPDFSRIDAGLSSLANSHNFVDGGAGRDMVMGDLNVAAKVPEDATGSQGFFRDIWIGQYGAAFDRLFGGSGEDTLASGAGLNDELSGGTGSDVFVFDTPNGDYNIMDFEDGWDMIVIADEGMEIFSDLTINQTVRGAVVSFNDTQITFHGINQAELGANDFVFL